MREKTIMNKKIRSDRISNPLSESTFYFRLKKHNPQKKDRINCAKMRNLQSRAIYWTF